MLIENNENTYSDNVLWGIYGFYVKIFLICFSLVEATVYPAG